MKFATAALRTIVRLPRRSLRPFCDRGRRFLSRAPQRGVSHLHAEGGGWPPPGRCAGRPEGHTSPASLFSALCLQVGRGPGNCAPRGCGAVQPRHGGGGGAMRPIDLPCLPRAGDAAFLSCRTVCQLAAQRRPDAKLLSGERSTTGQPARIAREAFARRADEFMDF